MSITKGEVRSGVYYDSIVLMQLQRALSGLPGVLDAGVVMGTEANKHLLAQGDLLAPEVQSASPEEMLIVVKAADDTAAQAALQKVVSQYSSSAGAPEALFRLGVLYREGGDFEEAVSSWNTLVDKSGNILKSKFPVVLRMAHKTAAFGTEFP